MTVLYLGALAAIALPLSVLMTGDWTAQHIAVRMVRHAYERSGCMSFVSRMIGTAERVPLPDVG
jgi:hypothetical protein